MNGEEKRPTSVRGIQNYAFNSITGIPGMVSVMKHNWFNNSIFLIGHQEQPPSLFLAILKS